MLTTVMILFHRNSWEFECLRMQHVPLRSVFSYQRPWPGVIKMLWTARGLVQMVKRDRADP